MSRRLLYTAIALVIVAGVALGVLCAGLKSAVHEPIAATGGESLGIAVVGSSPYYLQTDPAWADLALGQSGDKMANAGCTVCCIAMGLSALGHPLDPGEVCQELSAVDGFTESGQVVWQAVKEITGGDIGIEIPGLSHETIDAELAERRPVIAKVMLAETVPHWLLVVGKDRLEYRIMDPLDQEKEVRHLSKRSETIEAVRVFVYGNRLR